MIRPRILLALLLLTSLLFTIASVDATLVKRVVDGDTIELAEGTKVRYLGIDTPEAVHPSKPVEFMGKEASELNRQLVEGKDVRLEFDVQRTDKYGRTLAYVYVDTIFVNAELVKRGFAQVLTIPPNVKYSDVFLRLQREARELKTGLWNDTARVAWRSPSPDTDPKKLYITRTGKRYHQGNCKYLAKSAIEITLKEAKEKGYTPCLVCLSKKPETNSDKIYITKTGSKYHRGGCRYLSRSAIPISLTDARARGYGACSVCIGKSVKSTKQTYIAGGRCLATTKKGTQCKRKAKSGKSYCWQHGG